ncbi:MAG: DUF4845 domain-containing protein [Proteobacteria bacterium]|jgi:hypothetical protein|nr:DUF4845 domain-containing protein [Pseudomonadota bacterium]
MNNRQRGGVGSWVIIIIILGGSLSMGLKLVPLYMDHSTMSKVLDRMSEEEGVSTKGKKEIQDMVIQRFKLNNIRDFPVRDELEINRSGKGTELALNYEVRIKLISNLDLIASFDKTVKLRD